MTFQEAIEVIRKQSAVEHTGGCYMRISHPEHGTAVVPRTVRAADEVIETWAIELFKKMGGRVLV